MANAAVFGPDGTSVKQGSTNEFGAQDASESKTKAPGGPKRSGVESKTRTQQKPEWRHILGAADGISREWVLERYRAMAHTPDCFERSRVARADMADALTRAEDRLELMRGSKADSERARIRLVRRQLESEIA